MRVHQTDEEARICKNIGLPRGRLGQKQVLLASWTEFFGRDTGIGEQGQHHEVHHANSPAKTDPDNNRFNMMGKMMPPIAASVTTTPIAYARNVVKYWPTVDATGVKIIPQAIPPRIPWARINW